MGKPQFPGIEFNISSSNLVLGLGVSQNQRPIGIDLSHEQQRIDPHSIVDQFRSIMSDDEVDQLESMSDVGQRYLKFNHLWTLKEAYSKYLALGLNMDLASCSFEMGKLDDTENKFPPESETEVLPLHVNWTQLFLQTQTQKCHSCVVKPPINPDRLPVILSVVHDESHPAKVYYIDMFIVADHPDDFRSEPKFVSALQLLISDKVQDDFSFIIEAGTNALTFMPIYDFREIPSYCRVPNIESVFGYIQVDDLGKMIPGTYQSNVMYRMCNWNGLPKFSDFMYEQIKQKLELEVD
ncbi:uncharacterized protein KQ657_002269 [Scheffersomyces spartinae]|uniref:4'-phosphopantetheinyl transferase domain-containing protein n=1 Tax=Scheffersomyces spartinae TaxID=45513 RepID=A0A9P7VDK1_9ASCO|nr:uncharacterized protein KQ657_002269 [Scheffersomyces spartinae]KAG7195884.1 hypothetical protein KQ657_002269 [Scheffersomyces spartinae]